MADNADLAAAYRDHELLDEFYSGRTADLSKITVPVLSAANWGSFALHLRGNLEGFQEVGSEDKWLEVHDGNHFAPFYSEESRLYQERFLARWLKDDADAWTDERRVKLFIRNSTGGSFRYEDEWPIARTRWTPYYLNATTGSLRPG